MSSKVGLRVFPNLHFYIIYRVFIIFHVDIQSYALALVAVLHDVFCLGVHEFADFDAQYHLQQVLANTLVTHDQLEHIVISNGQVFPLFVFVR